MPGWLGLPRRPSGSPGRTPSPALRVAPSQPERSRSHRPVPRLRLCACARSSLRPARPARGCRCRRGPRELTRSVLQASGELGFLRSPLSARLSAAGVRPAERTGGKETQVVTVPAVGLPGLPDAGPPPPTPAWLFFGREWQVASGFYLPQLWLSPSSCQWFSKLQPLRITWGAKNKRTNPWDARAAPSRLKSEPRVWDPGILLSSPR